MAERRQPDFDPEDAARVIAGDLPSIETPVIDMQDTRVTDKGEKVQPLEKMFAREDAKARKAIEEFERQLKRLPPD